MLHGTTNDTSVKSLKYFDAETCHDVTETCHDVTETCCISILVCVTDSFLCIINAKFVKSSDNVITSIKYSDIIPGGAVYLKICSSIDIFPASQLNTRVTDCNGEQNVFWNASNRKQFGMHILYNRTFVMIFFVRH